MKNLNSVQRAIPSAVGLPHPHALLESADHYSIVMNLLDVNPRDIDIRTDWLQREITITVRKESALRKRAFYWVFGIPEDASILAASVRFLGGALEVRLPRTAAETWMAA